MVKVQLYLYVFFIGFTSQPLIDWLNLFAADLTAYCVPPSELLVKLKLLDWKKQALRMTKIGDFTKSRPHSQHEFKIDSCHQRRVFESRDNISDNYDQVIDYEHLAFIGCQNGWIFEPSRQVSLRGEFNLVCHREKYLYFGQIILGFCASLAFVVVYMLNRAFDLRFLCKRNVRLLVIFFCLSLEVIAFSPLDINFSTFILIRSLASFFYSIYFGETMWALSMKYGEEFHVCYFQVAMFKICGYIFGSLLWSTLMTTISDWRLLGAYSIGISNVIIIILTIFVDDEPLTIYMPSNVERIATISRRSDIPTIETATTENAGNDDQEISVYRSCEEQVSVSISHSESKISSTISLLYISISTMLTTGFYYTLTFASRDQNCWWRRYGKIWCFAEKPTSQFLIMILISTIQITFDTKTMLKTGIISSIVSMAGILSIVLNRLFDGDQMLDDDLFSFYLNTFGLIACISSAVRLIWFVTNSRSHSANVVWAASFTLAWSMAPAFNFWWNNDHNSRDIMYLCFTFIILTIGCLNKEDI